MKKIGVLGAGSWGCALAMVLGDNGHEVTIWSNLEDEVEMLLNKHEQVDKLPGVKLPLNVTADSDLEKVARESEMLILAVPSKFVRETARKIKDCIKEDTIIVDVAKGIEADTLMTLSEQILDEVPKARVGILSGPSHAEEVGNKIPTLIVASAHDEKTAKEIQNTFINEYFRVYTSPDIRGIEIGGALKNVIALAAGIADGLGTGDNTKAALITRGLKEIASIGENEGGNHETFYGLTGMGDLIVTCASIHSRNRKAGVLIGQGKTMEEAMGEVKMIVEGVYSAKAALELAEKHNLEVPIIKSVYDVLFNGRNASEALQELMIRKSKVESSLLPW